MKKHLLLAGAIASLAMPAAAEGLYLVGDINQTTIELGSYDDSDNGFSLGGGYKFNQTFSVEASYRDLGGLRAAIYDSKASMDFTAIQLSLLASKALNEQLAIYGRVGMGKISVDAKFTSDDLSMSGSESENKALVGVGARFTLTEKAGLRFEYSRFQEWDDITLSNISLGVDYSF